MLEPQCFRATRLNVLVGTAVIVIELENHKVSQYHPCQETQKVMNAGHWLLEEQPQQTMAILTSFMEKP